MRLRSLAAALLLCPALISAQPPGDVTEQRVRAVHAAAAPLDAHVDVLVPTTPGIYRTTLTAPDLFKRYLIEQFSVILKNHGGAIEVGESLYAFGKHVAAAGPAASAAQRQVRHELAVLGAEAQRAERLFDVRLQRN